MANYVVGDLQAHISPLKRLLKAVEFNPKYDALWAVGDLIGRGPEPLETLLFLRDLGDACKVVLGNHDLHFLSVYLGLKKNKNADNFTPLLESEHCHKLVEWLRCQPLARLIDDNHLLVHAGLFPYWSFADAIKHSQEIEAQLQCKHWSSFLEVMYGNAPSHWKDASTQEEVWRFTVNACTRMRYLTTRGELDFSAKMHPDEKPLDLTPWFDVPNEALKTQQKVIFGHWASLVGQTQNPQFIGLDTGYIWGGKMTLLHLESKSYFTCDKTEKIRT